MRTLNQVTLIGRVGRDPEVRTISGAEMVRFSIATSRSYKQGDEWKEITQWHNITAWRTTAEHAAKFNKGDLVLVQGSIEYREHKGSYYTDIIADRVQLFDRPNVAKSLQASPASVADNNITENNVSGNDDDIPF